MKIKVQNRHYDDEQIIMKTSKRGGEYSIRFHKLNGFEYGELWGHLNKRQAKKLMNELKLFIDDNTAI